MDGSTVGAEDISNNSSVACSSDSNIIVEGQQRFVAELFTA
jgi:hypothetical protein